MSDHSLELLYYHPTEAGKRKRQLLNLPRDTVHSKAVTFQLTGGLKVANSTSNTNARFDIAGGASDAKAQKWFQDIKGELQLKGFINNPLVDVDQLVTTSANKGTNVFGGTGGNIRNLCSKAGPVMPYAVVNEEMGRYGDANIGLYPFNLNLKKNDPLSVQFSHSLFDGKSAFNIRNRQERERQKSATVTERNNRVGHERSIYDAAYEHANDMYQQASGAETYYNNNNDGIYAATRSVFVFNQTGGGSVISSISGATGAISEGGPTFNSDNVVPNTIEQRSLTNRLAISHEYGTNRSISGPSMAVVGSNGGGRLERSTLTNPREVRDQVFSEARSINTPNASAVGSNLSVIDVYNNPDSSGSRLGIAGDAVTSRPEALDRSLMNETLQLSTEQSDSLDAFMGRASSNRVFGGESLSRTTEEVSNGVVNIGSRPTQNIPTTGPGRTRGRGSSRVIPIEDRRRNPPRRVNKVNK